MRILKSFSKAEDAHLLRARLEGSGISAYVRDEFTVSMYWFYSDAIGGVKVEVADEDYERAVEVLGCKPDVAAPVEDPSREKGLGWYTVAVLSAAFLIAAFCLALE